MTRRADTSSSIDYGKRRLTWLRPVPTASSIVAPRRRSISNKSAFGTEFVGDIMRHGDVPAHDGQSALSEDDKQLIMNIQLPTGGATCSWPRICRNRWE